MCWPSLPATCTRTKKYPGIYPRTPSIFATCQIKRLNLSDKHYIAYTAWSLNIHTYRLIKVFLHCNLEFKMIIYVFVLNQLMNYLCLFNVKNRIYLWKVDICIVQCSYIVIVLFFSRYLSSLLSDLHCFEFWHICEILTEYERWWQWTTHEKAESSKHWAEMESYPKK